MGAYQSFARWVGDKAWVRPLARRVLPKVDTVLLRSNGWRATPFPTLLLTTIGHHSGGAHLTPLYYVEDDGFLVIASNYGGEEPHWSRNLRATPACTIKVGRLAMAAKAEPVSDDQWDEHLDAFADFYPPYRDHVARAEREIPIWKLKPMRPASGPGR